MCKRFIIFGICLYFGYLAYNVHALEYLSEYGVAAVKKRNSAYLIVFRRNVGGPVVLGRIGSVKLLAGVLHIAVGSVHDIELASVGACSARICVSYRAGKVVQIFGSTAFKFFAPDRFAAGAVALGVSALVHKVRNNPVEDQFVVVSHFRKSDKVLNTLGSVLGKKLDLYLAHVLDGYYRDLFARFWHIEVVYFHIGEPLNRA